MMVPFFRLDGKSAGSVVFGWPGLSFYNILAQGMPHLFFSAPFFGDVSIGAVKTPANEMASGMLLRN